MDVVITTNGPGEVSTWVSPIIAALKKLAPDCRIWVFLTPCMFAGGGEKEVLSSFKGINGVFGPGEYLSYQVFGKRPAGFLPGESGVVFCLGGDLSHARRIGRSLGYRSAYAYCDRAAGLLKNDFCYFVPSARIAEKFIAKGVKRDRVRVAGCLAACAVRPKKSGADVRASLGIAPDAFILNILPGSRLSFIEYTIPFFIDVAGSLNRSATFLFTLAPYLSIKDLGAVLDRCGAAGWSLGEIGKEAVEIKTGGVKIFVYHGNQYDAMGASDLAVALPGSSNIELLACGVPALVVLPLNHPDKIPLPGIMEYVCRIPLAGKIFKKQLIQSKLNRKFNFVSPVNRDAVEEVFPEMVGILKPAEVAARLESLIDGEHEKIRLKLKGSKAESDAAEKMVRQIVGDMKGYN